MPRVSVIIPAYNAAQYIHQAVKSVLNQTYQDIETIVVDDGSIDDTAECLSAYGSSIRYIWQENQERAVARNRGIEVAQGEYVAFLDADDYWLPHKLEKQVGFADANPEVGLIYNYAKVVDRTDKVVRTWGTKDRPPEGRVGIDLLKWFVLGHSIPTPSVMVRRSCLEKIGVFDESLTYCEDWDLWMRIAQVYPVGHVPEFLTCFRVFHKYRPEVFAHHNLQEKHLYVIRKVLESEETIPLEIRNNALARIIWWGALVDFGIKDAAAARKRIQKHYAEGLLCGMNSRELANEVVGFAAGLFDDHTPVADAVEFIDFVFMNIPVELAHLQQHRRWALGTLFRRYAFQARYEGDGEYARSLMWRSVSMWPPYIFDIGVITTCLTGTWRDKYRSKTSTGNQGN